MVGPFSVSPLDFLLMPVDRRRIESQSLGMSYRCNGINRADKMNNS